MRLLTSGELVLLRSVFKDMLPYERLRISKNQPFPNDIFFDSHSVVPFDRPYFSPHVYSDDFSTGEAGVRCHFIHEFTHVWQYYHGVCPILEHVFHGFYVDSEYDYFLSRGFSFFSFNIEQQASIIADYYGMTFANIWPRRNKSWVFLLDSKSKTQVPNFDATLSRYGPVISEFRRSGPPVIPPSVTAPMSREERRKNESYRYWEGVASIREKRDS